MLAPHISRIKKGEFVLSSTLHPKTQKPQYSVTKVSKVLDESILGYTVKDSHIRKVQVEVSLRDIHVNLGLEPPPMAFGPANFDAYFRHRTEHPTFGSLHWSWEPDEAAQKRVNSSFSATYAWLKANGLQRITDLPIVYEIHHRTTKHVGRYSPSSDFAKKPGLIRFSPMHPSLESISASSYVVSHEIGHLIEFQLLDQYPKTRAKWLALYHDTVGPLDVSADVCADLYSRLIASSNMREFRQSVQKDEELLEPAKAIFEHLKRTRYLHPFDIETMLLAGTESQLKAVWPHPAKVLTVARKPLVSDYSTESPHELFAESFAFLVAGKKLPAAVTDLMERSLNYARKRLPVLLDEIDQARTSSTTDE